MAFTADYIDFKYRHKFIQWLINIDLPGFRKLAHLLPEHLIPKPTGPIHLRMTNDLLIWIDPIKDQGVERTLYYTGTYEMGTLSLLDQFLPEGGTFLDVGANIGLMSLYAANIVGEQGKVIAFEPNKETRAIAMHNVEINEFDGRIQLIAKGAGSKNEQKELFENWAINRGAASLISTPESVVSQTVEITSVDEEIGGRHIDVMKVDVEGYELEALKGAKSLLSRKHPPILIVECTQETEHASYTREELFDFIQDVQPLYDCFKLKGTKLRRSALTKVERKDQLPTHDNLICIPVRR